MDHGAVIDTKSRRRGPRRPAVATVLLAAVLLTAPGAAHASTPQQPDPPDAATPTTTAAAASTAAPVGGATLVDPADGKHFDHLELAPMLQFDPSKDAAGKQEQPKWILLATDREMKTTVRYCRQFVWAAANGGYHWGCNRWATGVDQAGNDQLLALEAGKVYYWQVVSKSNSADAPDVLSAVRSFAIDPEKPSQSPADIAAHVNGTVFDDGTQLNLGVAAFVNSGVRVKTIASSRLATYAFRIRATHVGSADASRSYVKVVSAAGTRYLKVAKLKTGVGVGTVWRLTAAEQRLKTKRFSYQLYLKSTKNGAMVRSPLRVVLIKTAAKAPAWTPD